MSEDSVEDKILRGEQFLKGLTNLANDSNLPPPILFHLLGLFCKSVVRQGVEAGIGTGGVLGKSVIGNFAGGLGLEVELRDDTEDEGPPNE